MERTGIERAFAAMYEHTERYPGCIMFSALPDAPVVEAHPGALARIVRRLRDARTRGRHGGRARP